MADWKTTGKKNYLAYSPPVERKKDTGEANKKEVEKEKKEKPENIKILMGTRGKKPRPENNAQDKFSELLPSAEVLFGDPDPHDRARENDPNIIPGLPTLLAQGKLKLDSDDAATSISPSNTTSKPVTKAPELPSTVRLKQHVRMLTSLGKGKDKGKARERKQSVTDRLHEKRKEKKEKKGDVDTAIKQLVKDNKQMLKVFTAANDIQLEALRQKFMTSAPKDCRIEIEFWMKCWDVSTRLVGELDSLDFKDLKTQIDELLVLKDPKEEFYANLTGAHDVLINNVADDLDQLEKMVAEKNLDAAATLRDTMANKLGTVMQSLQSAANTVGSLWYDFAADMMKK